MNFFFLSLGREITVKRTFSVKYSTEAEVAAFLCVPMALSTYSMTHVGFSMLMYVSPFLKTEITFFCVAAL